jgi:AcrR family transcriptional regulator
MQSGLTEPSPGDTYWRRRVAGNLSREQTREKILRSADALFREQGYAATTVTAIALRAGVSVQTLYLAWHSKRVLFNAAADASMDLNADLSPEEVRLRIRDTIRAKCGPEPTAGRYVQAIADILVPLADGTAAYWALTRDAAAVDAKLAEDFAERTAERRRTIAEISADFPLEGTRPGTTRQMISDTLWVLVSPEAHDLMSNGAGSADHYHDWLVRTLTAALCAP